MDTVVSKKESRVMVEAPHAGFAVSVEKGKEDVDLPVGSPFSDWREARRFAGPMPFTFTYKEKAKEVLMIEGVRSHWEPRPIKVNAYTIPFLQSLGAEHAVLANAFIVEDVPYFWKKGKVDPWKHA